MTVPGAPAPDGAGAGPPWGGGPRADTAHRREEASGWAALVVVYVVWGSSYLAIRVGDESIPPLFMAGARYLVAGGILLPFVMRRPRGTAGVGRRRLPTASQLIGCSIVGVLLLTGGNGGVSYAERSLPSSLAALLVASVPLWMVAIDRLLTRSFPSATALVALVVGFLGVALVARPRGHGETVGVLVVLLASLSWATGSLLSRRLAQPRRPLEATAFQMLAGGAALMILALATGEIAHFSPSAVSARSWLALAYLIGPGAILALTCYTTALRLLPTSTVSTYAYVNPIIAVFLGWALLSESITATTLIGGGLVVLAVALVVSDRRRRT